MKRPSTRQRVLHYIRRFWRDYNYPPMPTEIANALRLGSERVVRYHLHHLRAAGAIDWQEGHARTITLKEAAA